MARSRRNKQPTPVPAPSHARFWLSIALSALVLAGVGLLDYATPPGISCLFFYLVPIGLAKWLAGKKAGFVFCIGAAAVSLSAALAAHQSFLSATWNAGIALAVFLTVIFLLHRLKGHGAELGSLVRTVPRICATAAVCACLLGGTALLAYRAFASGGGISGAEAGPLLAKMARDVQECMQASRPVLLGSRDPNGPSCIQIVMTGDVAGVGTMPVSTEDLDGGPGTRMTQMSFSPWMRGKTPTEDFAWHQGRLKTLLDNMAAGNRDPRRLSEDLAKDAREFSRRLGECTRFPAGFSPAKFSAKGDWPSFCLSSLNEAVAARDLPAAKRWAAEFASAMLSLEDLHRWLDFLVANYLAALEFQARCESLFTWATPRVTKYWPNSSIGDFPAGMLTLHGSGNYLEVERQAEQLFQVPKERLAAAADQKRLTDGSVWVPPRLREIFLKLEEKLSPANRQTWEQAARTPYEHAYLVNMLFRASRGGMEDQLAIVLGRLNEIKPNASVGELMSVLMYRGHSFGGLEWADRYQPQLMQAATDLHGSDEDAFLAAHRYTYGFYRACEYSFTFTLREAIDRKRMDCVRATDMMGDVFRNSGRARLGHVRWSSGTNAHSVATITTGDGDQRKTLLLDGMAPMAKPEVWPDAYLHGHAWPPGFENTNDPPYCMELYVRGLDNYVWAEGYIARDAGAGTLMKAAVPYLPGRGANSTENLLNQASSQTAGTRPNP
jgi:hypothetical protein